ncbi:hypothetical protein VTL71DRAFT_16199 [Oculimacula yallundae]|uniref:Secreted protein n=1 Tax=Oculimacula yallundae TaxID=86028 RepID=A0ABR4CFV2_9HELO
MTAIYCYLLSHLTSYFLFTHQNVELDIPIYLVASYRHIYQQAKLSACMHQLYLDWERSLFFRAGCWARHYIHNLSLKYAVWDGTGMGHGQ